METIAQEAKRLLEPIPEDKIVLEIDIDEDKDQWTASFHIGSKIGARFAELIGHSFQYLKYRGEYCFLSTVAEGKTYLYYQPTPKQRVMALLDDMIAAGY